MPPVDIPPLMDHPAWATAMTPAQRKQALDLWQAPETTDSDRAEMRQVMDGWAAEAESAPKAAGRVVSSVGGMLKEVPGVVMNALAIPGRAASGGPLSQPQAPAPPQKKPQTPQEWEAKSLPMEQQLAKGVGAIPGLMAGPLMGRAGYGAGEALLTQLAPRLPQSMQTAARALPAMMEAGGNYVTRQANVAMGNEPPGVRGDVTSVALPLAVRGMTSAPVARRVPGAAVTQHERAAEDTARMVTGMQPATSAADLYARVAGQHNPAIPVNNLRQTAQDIIDRELREGPSTRNTAVLGIANELHDLAMQHNDQVPMDLLYERMQRIGERLHSASRTDDSGTRELSRLYAGFHGALEDAASSNIPGAETLQEAIKASRQEHAVERLGRITGQGRGITTQQGTGYTLVSGKKMLNEFERLLADDHVFRDSFTPAQQAEMRDVFESAGRLPALPPPPSVQRGAGKAALSGSLGGAAGYVVGGPEGAKFGTMAGIAAPEVISRLMMTSGGRAMLRAAFEGRDTISPEVLAVLSQAARQGVETYTSKRD